MQNWAVFTGDIVRSTDLGAQALSDVMDVLAETAQSVGNWPDSTSDFVRFRGDGWQMALPPLYAMRAALVIRAAVRATGKGHDTRIGIGIGAGTIVDGDLARADGPAFVASGHALDALTRTPRLAAPGAPQFLRTALPLADRIAQGWTPKQAQVVQVMLSPLASTQDALAQTLGRSRQMIQKQADAAGLDALLACCEACETPNAQPN